MLSGIAAASPGFLADLNNTEQRISRDDQEISSGISVSVASDSPDSVTPLLDDQNQIAQVTQTITNLKNQQTVVQTADGALQAASSLLNQLISLGTQEATVTASAASRASVAQQVQEIEQQLVSIANTNVQGQYVFGGDAPRTQPYMYTGVAPNGVTSNGSPSNTLTLNGLDGSSIVPGLTAGQIFDAQLPNNGGPDPGNVFVAVYQLETALSNNDQTAVESSLTSVQAAATHVSQCSALYGVTENWIQDQITTATARSTMLTSAVSALRDADVATLATDMSQDEVALQAALSAQGNLPTRSLFSYLA